MRDDELVEAIRRGDQEAASSLVGRYWEGIFRYLYRISCNSHDAEELTQQTFVRLFEHVDDYRKGTNFQAWVYRVATNLFLDYRRRSKHRGEMIDGGAATAPPSESPDAVARERELAAAVEQAIMSLPDEQRIVLTLRVNEGMSHSEIAKVLNAEEATVRWRLHKARLQLMKRLETYL